MKFTRKGFFKSIFGGVNTTIVISKPKTDTFKAQFKNDIR